MAYPEAEGLPPVSAVPPLPAHTIAGGWRNESTIGFSARSKSDFVSAAGQFQDRDYDHTMSHQRRHLVHSGKEAAGLVLSQLVGQRTACRFAVWFIFITASLVISGIQSYQFVTKYLSSPSSTLFTVVRNESLTPPSVTICPEPGRNLAAEQQLFESFQTGNDASAGNSSGETPSRLTLLEFIYERNLPVQATLSRLAYATSEIIPGCQISDRTCVPRASRAGEWSVQWYNNLQLNTRVCYTLRPNITMSIGINELFVLSLNIPRRSFISNSTGNSLVRRPGDVGWYIYFHESNVKITDLDRVTYVPYTFLEPAVGNMATVTYIEFTPNEMTFLDSPERRCTDEPGYVYEKCVEDCILSSDYFDCHVPYPSAADYSKVSKPPCENRTSYSRYNAAYSLMWRNMNKRLSDLQRSCDCPQRCSSTRYHVNFVKLRIPDNDTAASAGPRVEFISSNPNVTQINPNIRIRGYFPSSEVETFSEQWSYDFYQLIGEMGGSLGLFLGFSFLSIISGAEILFITFANVARKRRVQDSRKKRSQRELENDVPGKI